ncbi:MAG: succinylglutamate desuccinylase/aspartoacylase family protein [Pseudomonadota bacterium]
MPHLCAVSCDLDYESRGKRAGSLDVTLSDNDHAFSALQVPIGVIAGGPGPTALLTAGSHGDEYEGQVILHRLMRDFEPRHLTGRLILLPALNLPAVRARQRVSPLDDGNMNRSFPGHGAAGPTAAIASYVSRELIPRADVILDFHSGGTATRHVDCGFVTLGKDEALNQANLDLARCFGAPFTMVCASGDYDGDFDSEAHRQSTAFLACELGGFGTVSRASLDIGWRGSLRVLDKAGILSEEARHLVPQPAGKTHFIDVGQKASHVTAPREGLAQILVAPGQAMLSGDPIAELYSVSEFGTPSEILTAPRAGIVSVVRRNPLVAAGDHLVLISALTEAS